MRHTIGLAIGIMLTLIWGCDVENANGLSLSDPSPGKRLCVVDADCFRGEVCFAGECVFQRVVGDALPPPEREPEPDMLPEEREMSIAAFTHPAAGQTQVYVARPAADSVVRIHGETLALTAIEVGDEPSVVRIIPGTDSAVVLNRGSDELTIIDDAGDPRFILLDAHFNALQLTPDGRYALCWFDLSLARPGERFESFQDLMVVNLATAERHAVTVGFRPRRLQFTADGATALVITDDGISYFRPAELGETTLADTVPTAPDVFQQDDREVVVSDDGRWAISRGPDEPGVTLVELAEGLPRFIPLPGQPTDIDLVPDGTAALVMMRGARQLAIVPFEVAREDPEGIHLVAFEDHVLGSAAVGLDFAVLYTTQTETRAQISLLDLATLRIVHRPIRKAVAGVELSPDGRTAIIVHQPTPEPAPAPPMPDGGVTDGGVSDGGVTDAMLADGAMSDGAVGDAALADAALADADLADAALADAEPLDAELADANVGRPKQAQPDDFLRSSHGYSLLDIRTARVKLQTTAAPPSGLVFAPERDEAFLVLRGDDVASVQRIDLNGFAVQSWDLGTPPEVIGVLPDIERAFVTQTHPEGRISFIQLDAESGDGGRLETVSGYALNGRID